MFARSTDPSLAKLRIFTLTLAAGGACLLPLPAWAQVDKDGSSEPAAAKASDDEDEEEEEAGEAKKAPGTVAQTAQVEATASAKPAVAPAAEEDPREPVDATDGLYRSKMKLGWDGSGEIDVGYARYGFSLASYKPERINDFRGRFVLGPVLEYAFDENHFFRLTGQAVAWVREEKQQYQVNADDVYVQAGRRKKWDVKLGRFETWVVYDKGLGYDRYTLEDTGAMKEAPFNQAIFGADIYEVNAIYGREMPGNLAVHAYPLDILGFELVGQYGSGSQTTNRIGGRLAADLNLKFLRIRGGAEYRKEEPTLEATRQENGVDVPCDKCSDKTVMGFGGGAVGKLGPVELGLNAAKANLETYKTDGTALELPATYDVTSFGGYVQLDPGKLVFDRSLIIGVGMNRTENLYENQDFERHDQGAAYLAFPLGFNDAMVKLVISKADLLYEDADTATGVVTARTSDMVAGRLRVRASF